MGARKAVARKLLLIVLATTASALLMTVVAMAFYDLHTFRRTWIDDLDAQADILGLAAAPALEFEDPESAQDYLELLRAKPRIIGAAIYTATGTLFAAYSASSERQHKFPAVPLGEGFQFENNALTLYQRIVSNDEILGTVYLEAEYDITGRLVDYLGIGGAVMFLSLSAALLVSRRLQRSITRPISAITAVARNVIEKQDFDSRAPKTSDDEIGVLVDAFNGMLAEIGTRTEVLESSNRRLEQTEERLRSLNNELEARVKARTAELEAANKDLEGFSYSVSHDLRAPIRGITGFCSLFEADHGKQLDAEAQRKLGIIKSESQRMGALIDDLLAFSRLGRRSLQPVELDMREIVERVVDRLKDGEGAEKAEFRIGPMPPAHADSALLEQVWINLLSNAVKFSSHEEQPLIEVGGIAEEHERLYFVRDNGAGFDPKYIDRLFGVFQRLHHDNEFPGTGVGLALVHRIITRHGGRVWGDAKLGEGATFHFTLPKEYADGKV